jgi:hypothetical protein
MDAMPEKLYYLPLPRSPSVRMPHVAFSTSGARRRWDGVEEWSTAHTHDAVLGMLTVVLAFAVGALVAQI